MKREKRQQRGSEGEEGNKIILITSECSPIFNTVLMEKLKVTSLAQEHSGATVFVVIKV